MDVRRRAHLRRAGRRKRNARAPTSVGGRIPVPTIRCPRGVRAQSPDVLRLAGAPGHLSPTRSHDLRHQRHGQAPRRWHGVRVFITFGLPNRNPISSVSPQDCPKCFESQRTNNCSSAPSLRYSFGTPPDTVTHQSAQPSLRPCVVARTEHAVTANTGAVKSRHWRCQRTRKEPMGTGLRQLVSLSCRHPGNALSGWGRTNG